VAYACIDIGSTTTRLLVAEPSEGRLRELMTQRAVTSLGKAITWSRREGRTRAAQIELMERATRAAIAHEGEAS
jgi:exopolyphosphatase/pppGpp-phosphohydrolase